jgi:flagellar biosynthesis protein FlhB
MAEEASGDKTEPATPRRREDAMKSGRSARSHDLSAAILLVAGLVVIRMTGQGFIQHMTSMMAALLGGGYWGSTSELMDNSVRIAASHMVPVLAPIFITAAVVALIISVVQNGGFRFNPAALQPNFTRLNPIGGLGRFFTTRNGVQMAMSLAKLSVVAGVLIVRLRSQFPLVLSLVGVDFPQNMGIAVGLVYDLGLRLAVALLILSLLDWIYQKWKFERDIRMSKQEIKEEAKRMEGDMETKGRRRQLARRMLLQRIQSDVPRADVVVTNPTELAIALKYDPDTMGAPRVLAKGADYMAMRIRQVAVEHGIPIVERKPLAQAIYKSVEIGHEVPPQFYQAIAEILAYVYELAGKGRRIQNAAAHKPRPELQEALGAER